MPFEGRFYRRSDRYLKKGVSESIVYAIKHVIFQLYWAYPDRVVTTELITKAFLYKSVEVEPYASAPKCS